MKKRKAYFFTLLILVFFCGLAAAPFAPAQNKSASVTINKVEGEKSSGAGSAPAETEIVEDYRDPTPASLPNPVFAFIRSLGSLVFILALVYLSIYGLKMFMSKKPGFAFSSGIKVLESTFLSQNKSLHLVEVGGEMLLLGVTDGGMNVLKEINDPSAIAALRAKMDPSARKPLASPRQSSPRAPARQAPSSFKDIFKTAAENFKAKNLKVSDTLPQEMPPLQEEKIRNSLNILRKELEKIQEIRKKEIS